MKAIIAQVLVIISDNVRFPWLMSGFFQEKRIDYLVVMILENFSSEGKIHEAKLKINVLLYKGNVVAFNVV